MHWAKSTVIHFYQLCEYVTSSHNESLSVKARPRTFLYNNSFHFHTAQGSKVTSVQQRQGWTHPSIFINVISQWPVTSLPLIAVSIVPSVEKTNMWVSSVSGRGVGMARSMWDTQFYCAVVIMRNHVLKEKANFLGLSYKFGLYLLKTQLQIWEDLFLCN